MSSTKHRCGEWCDEHQRRECDRLIPLGGGRATTCGKPTTWRAPLNDSRFPLAYCAEHAPTEGARESDGAE